MKQVLQHLRSGELEVAEVPCPLVRSGSLLIQTRASLISAGTERMLVEFAQGNLISKARAQPEKVKQVLDKIKADGLLPTLEAVFAKLDEPLPLGYCNAGVVVEAGNGVSGFAPGDRVISNGAHAEMVCVPRNLCCRIPDNINDDQASFTVLASIGLQGIRLLDPTLGECIVVTGLGLIGLMAVQLLVANGCRVLGIDMSPARLALARQFGAETVDLSAGGDPVSAAEAFSQGRGVDGVLICAATKSSEIVNQAAKMCRKRGRIISVGAVGLELMRTEFYNKELTLQVSCSYGPGRYDPYYEERGNDYPLPFVRWTEQRNFEAILDLMAAGKLDVTPLISRRVEQAKAAEAYKMLTDDRAALGIVLQYGKEPIVREVVLTHKPAPKATEAAGKAVVGLVGAGNFSRLVALPNLTKTDARIACIADLNAAAASTSARKFGAERSTTDYHLILNDASINTMMIFTRHDMHAPMVLEALKAGKHVFVEKPLALNREDLDRVRETYNAMPGRQLMVGFNRRFSPHAVKMKSLLASRTQPLCMSMMVNAGIIPPDMWVHDPQVGGGRIIGEGCHYIDLMAFLADAPVVRVHCMRVGESRGLVIREDKATVTLGFADGSIGTLHYFANGSKSYPKETLEVFNDGKILRLENFRVLRGYGWKGFSKMKLMRQDKGHRAEVKAFIDSVIRGGPSVMPFDQIENVTKATFAACESAVSGNAIDIS